ncbi:MAG TPA: amidohydrolase [Verrucomicrobiae bacterium]|nr:amidohydrolase [Verrucomicrobiae bacterium]
MPALLWVQSSSRAELPPSITSAIDHAAAAMRPELVATRRDLHEHPELANREVRTSGVVARRLREIGLDEIRTNVAVHGVVALLKGDLPGPVVALRADMDALPIQETIDVPYKSLTPGVKHACGHDAHTAILLGVAKVLAGMRAHLHGSVKFLFQPAEEGPPPGEEGGAKLMVKEGALENPRPMAIFGLHVTPEIETGKIGYHAGPAQAAFDVFTLALRGKKVYAAWPEKGVDTMLVAGQCITALQSIKSRRIDAFEPVLFTIGKINGGTSPHAIAAEIKLEGSVRTFSPEVRKRIETLVRQTVAGVTEAYGATFTLDYQPGTSVVYNDPKLVRDSLPVLRGVVGETNLFEVPQRMGAEDFSFYEEVVPGFFLRLGSGNKAKGIVAESHTPEFDIDEDCLVIGVRAMSSLAMDFLQRQAEVNFEGRRIEIRRKSQ